MRVTAGTTVDRYSVLEELGQGGMATVYLVRHTSLGTLHALKVLTVTSDSIRERLIQEGRIQGTLQHPNIVSVTDMVDVGGSPGLIMQFISGPALDDFLRSERLTLEQADVVGRGILEGVAAAHELGLVHRDLKPGNVMLQLVGGRLIPKVADFGLAKVLAGPSGSNRTRSGMAMGTPAYMAPEQIRDAAKVDHRADVWSIGAILYELVSGVRAFGKGEMMDIFDRIRGGELMPIEERVPELPDRMIRAINGALTWDLDERIDSCTRLLAVWEGQEPLPKSVWDERSLERAVDLGRATSVDSALRSGSASTLNFDASAVPQSDDALSSMPATFRTFDGSDAPTEAPPADETGQQVREIPSLPAPERPPSRTGPRFAALALAFLAFVAAIAFWATRPEGEKTAHYHIANLGPDGWEAVGLLPEGHGLLKFVEATSRDGRFVELTYRNWPLPTDTVRTVRNVFEGEELVRIEHITGYGHAYRVQEVERDGDELILKNRDREGNPATGPYHSVLTERWTFDDDGATVVYGKLDGEPMSDQRSVFSVRYDRDDLGRTTSTAYFDPQDEEAATYREGLNRITRAFDDPNHPYRTTESARFGQEGMPIVAANGCHKLRYVYDDRGRHAERFCIGQRDAPVRDRTYGCHSTTVEYVEDSQVTTCVIDGETASARDGWVTMHDFIGEDGTSQRLEFRGADGELTANRKGYAIYHQRVDPGGVQVEIGPLMNADGEPTQNFGGIHHAVHKLDEYGNVIERTYLDEDGEPALSIQGFSTVRWTYDAAGNVTSKFWFGTDGLPTLNHKGIHGERNRRGPFRNHLVENFGVDGQPLDNLDGWATMKLEIDDNVGRFRVTEAFDAAGQPTIDKESRAFREERVYSPRGQLVQQAFFDTDGVPTKGSEGAEILVYEFDNRNLRSAHLYLDGDGNPPEETGVLHRAEFGWDARANPNAVSYFDIEGAPVAPPNQGNCARMSMEYEVDDRTRTECFSVSGSRLWLMEADFDVRGNRVGQRVHYRDASRSIASRSTFDVQGNVIEMHRIELDGEPTLDKDAWSRVYRTYDASNRLHRTRYTGLEGEPVDALSCGCHTEERVYDGRGLIIETRYTRADGTPRPEGDIVRHRRDLRGRIAEEALFHKDERPLTHPDGYTRTVFLRDRAGKETRRIRYDAQDRELKP